MWRNRINPRLVMWAILMVTVLVILALALRDEN
jgi:hypothetical protein